WLSSGEPLYRALYALTFSAQMLCYMLIGTVFNLLYRSKVSSKVGATFIALFFLAFAVQWPFGQERAVFYPGLIAYAAALAIFACGYAGRRYLRVPTLLNWLADISYSLYVIHGVAGYAVMRIAVDRGLGIAASIGIGTAFAFGAAALLHYLIERPTQAWG